MFTIDPPPVSAIVPAEDLAAPVHGLQVAVEYAVPVLVLGIEVGLAKFTPAPLMSMSTLPCFARRARTDPRSIPAS